jgi:hypothetical protein
MPYASSYVVSLQVNGHQCFVLFLFLIQNVWLFNLSLQTSMQWVCRPVFNARLVHWHYHTHISHTIHTNSIVIQETSFWVNWFDLIFSVYGFWVTAERRFLPILWLLTILCSMPGTSILSKTLLTWWISQFHNLIMGSTANVASTVSF